MSQKADFFMITALRTSNPTLIKICSGVLELAHADEETNRRTDLKKLICIFV
jgi:hypothetical protein